jgi:arylformamidase
VLLAEALLWLNIESLGEDMMKTIPLRERISRRGLLGAAAALAAPAVVTPAGAQECHIGPPPHEKGPRVFLDYDQVELDAAYDQRFYAPLVGQITKRWASSSAAVRGRIGEPTRQSYGPTEIEKLDIHRTKRANAPIFVFIHGGAWLGGEAKNYAYPAEMFVNAGAHYVALDFTGVREAGGDLRVMAEQVRRGIAWVHKNAASFGGDPDRLYIGGHSSGGHLCGVALVTDWKAFGLPADAVKGGLCMSGMYDMKAVRLSRRSSYVKFTDEMEDAMSSQRHLDRLITPIVVTYGGNETPEFQRQSREFAAAVKAAGKPVELIEAPDYNHFEVAETLGHPYGPNGRAALALMKLTSA